MKKICLEFTVPNADHELGVRVTGLRGPCRLGCETVSNLMEGPALEPTERAEENATDRRLDGASKSADVEERQPTRSSQLGIKRLITCRVTQRWRHGGFALEYGRLGRSYAASGSFTLISPLLLNRPRVLRLVSSGLARRKPRYSRMFASASGLNISPVVRQGRQW